jgi:hypothetical protein
MFVSGFEVGIQFAVARFYTNDPRTCCDVFAPVVNGPVPPNR